MSSTKPLEASVSTVESEFQTTGAADLKSLLFSFRGRIRRSTFWLYSIAATLTYFATVFVLSMLLGTESGIAALISLALYLPLIWTSLALQVKRWHDRNKSGWWVLISLIPIVGPLWVFIEVGCLAGTTGTNKFGADPLQSV